MGQSPWGHKELDMIEIPNNDNHKGEKRWNCKAKAVKGKLFKQNCNPGFVAVFLWGLYSFRVLWFTCGTVHFLRIVDPAKSRGPSHTRVSFFVSHICVCQVPTCRFFFSL